MVQKSGHPVFWGTCICCFCLVIFIAIMFAIGASIQSSGGLPSGEGRIFEQIGQAIYNFFNEIHMAFWGGIFGAVEEGVEEVVEEGYENVMSNIPGFDFSAILITIICFFPIVIILIKRRLSKEIE